MMGVAEGNDAHEVRIGWKVERALFPRQRNFIPGFGAFSSNSLP